MLTVMTWLTNIPATAVPILTKIAFACLALLIAWPLWRVICWFWSSEKIYSQVFSIVCSGCGQEIPLHHKQECPHCHAPYSTQKTPLWLRLKLFFSSIGNFFPIRLLIRVYFILGWIAILSIIGLMLWKYPIIEHLTDWQLKPLLSIGIISFFVAVLFLRKTFGGLGETFSTKILSLLIGGTFAAISMTSFNVTAFFQTAPQTPLATLKIQSNTQVMVSFSNGQKGIFNTQGQVSPLKMIAYYSQVDWPFVTKSSILLDSIAIGDQKIKEREVTVFEFYFWEKAAPYLSRDSFFLPTVRKASGEFYLTPGLKFDLNYDSDTGRVSLQALNAPPPLLPPTDPSVLPTPIPITP